MATQASVIRHLGGAPLFRGLSRPMLERIASLVQERQVSAGEVLCRQGEPGHELYIVVAGEASVTQGRRRLAVLRAGEVVGELALLDRGPRSATVTARTDLRVLVLGEMDFTALLDEVPALPHRLLAIMATRLRGGETHRLD